MKTRTSVSRQQSGEDSRRKHEVVSEPLQSGASETNESTNTSLQTAKKASSHLKSKGKFTEDIGKALDNEQLEQHSVRNNSKEKSDNFSEDETSPAKLSDNSHSPRKSGDRKSRNLDRVLRRMLKAKKESEKQSDSCRPDEIRSTSADIKSATGLSNAKHNFAKGEEGSERAKVGDRINNNSNSTLGMIDVQLPNSSHLPATGRANESLSTSSVVHHRGHVSPSRDAKSYSHDSRSLNGSPNTYSTSDNDELKPFVHSSTSSRKDPFSVKREDGTMSPIIKQEPVSTMDSRLAMYHTNGPVETHSPSSSYGSHPSPSGRSPTPNSPGGGSTGALPSPPELIMNAAPEQTRSPPNTGRLLMNGSPSSYLPTMVPPHSSPLAYAHRSPGGHSPHSMLAYSEAMARNPGVTAAAMAASGIGLPTLVPAMSAIPQNGPPPMFHMGDSSLLSRASLAAYSDPSNVYSQTRRGENDVRGPKVSPNAPLGPNPPRGIVGQKEAAAANEGRGGNGNRRGGSNVDEKCPYKRPPHTYPALIASAILDSPGNLITLRGIYDYIMNNFPYYKFGHDKSAWQNSIRHNLSLNQCFVKVPRYENAAKSNYWTMTREGFEEFGNENSFKRRRRRGATLAPISAYKSKKYGNNEGNTNNRVTKQRNGQMNSSAVPNGNIGWGGRSRTPEPNVGYNGAHDPTKGLKRPGSPGMRQGGRMEGKHQRMLVLKQGEGPALEGLSGRSDHPQRPNSLSSVEEMQGNLNSFSKSLTGTADGRPSQERSPRRNQGRNSPMNNLKKPTQQHQWMMAAAQKNLGVAGLFPPGLIASLTSTTPSLCPPMTSSESYQMKNQGAALDAQAKSMGMGVLGNGTLPVMLDHIEIGTQVPLFFDNNTVPTWSFLCRFCEFKHIDETPAVLEQHCRLLHHIEVTNAKAKAVAAAAVASSQREVEGSENHGDQAGIMSLQSMVSGFHPSMLAAAAGYNNAQSLIAAAHAAGITLPGSVPLPSSMSVSSAASSTAPYFSDPVMRSLAQQMGGDSPEHSAAAKSEAQHRQQMAAINSAMQQAAMTGAAGSMPQEQLRQMIYQQLLMQNSFFAGNTGLAAAMPRQIPGSRSDISPLAQFFQYQQKMMEIASAKAPESEEREKGDNSTKQSPDNVASRKSPSRKRKGSSSSTSSGQEAGHHPTTEENDKQTDIHGWKQCQDCDFTAKGAHGLDLHFRKAHAQDVRTESAEMRNDTASSQTQVSHTEQGARSRDGCSEATKVARRLSSNALDLSGAKTDVHGDSTALGSVSTAATQTEDEKTAEDRRSCPHCDVTFGDDTMHALHMSCHDRNDPFKCTICSQPCHEKYYFNVHLLRGLHQPMQAKEKRQECDVEEIKAGRRHSNTSEKSFSSTCSEGRSAPNSKTAPRRSPSSVSLPEVTSMSNGDVTSDNSA